MESEVFNKHVTRQIDQSQKVLVTKAREYAGNNDRIHNFKVASTLRNETNAQAALGMMSKHIVSVYDMVNSGKDFREAVWDEKIGDAINYLLIIRAIVAEENTVGVQSTPNVTS